jgi:hypothetical protein
MKSALMLAALCAALCVSTPAVQAKGMGDAELYCKLMPLTAKCQPAKAAAAKPVVMHVAATKLAPKAVTTKAPHLKMLSCEKATGKKFMYSCSWK